MKVTVKDRIYAGSKVMDLARALQPEVNTYGESIGVVEQASQQAELNAECIGRLLAWLVESNRMDIDTAKDIAAVSDDIEPFIETPEVKEQQERWSKPAPLPISCPECPSTFDSHEARNEHYRKTH